MNKITEYRLLRDVADEKKLTAQVNELIKQGFEPLGGPCACADNSTFFIYQAMVKYGVKQGPISSETVNRQLVTRAD